MKLIIQSLRQKAIEACGFAPDTFAHYWVKWIDDVDLSVKTGYAFLGNFIEDSLIEIDVSVPRLILVAASTGQSGYYPRGSRRDGYRYIYEAHQVLMLLPDGSLQRTGIESQDPEKWALQIRDQTAMVVKRLHSIGSIKAQPLDMAFTHLTERAAGYKTGQPLAWSAADLEAVMILLDATVDYTRRPCGGWYFI